MKTVDEVLKEYASRNNVILEQDPMAPPAVDPAAAPALAAPAVPPVVPPAPAAEEEEPKKPTSRERVDLIQLALNALGIDPSDLEAPEKAVFKSDVNPANAKKKRKQLETIISYHKSTESER